MDHATQAFTFEQVAEQVSRPLLRYFRRYSADINLADDLLQETLVRIARGLSSFDGRANVKTWAFAIATRVAADYFRKPEHRASIVEFDETSEIADEGPAIEERLIVSEMNSCVRQVIDSLPDDYRAALVLHDLEGLAAGDVAGICGCSLATAKIRIHRARLRLRDALQRQCEFYRDDDNVLRCDRKP